VIIWRVRGLQLLVDLFASQPAGGCLDVGAFYRRPSDPMGGFFLTRFAGVSRVGVVEDFAINALRALGQQPLKVGWEIRVALVRHAELVMRRSGVEGIASGSFAPATAIRKFWSDNIFGTRDAGDRGRPRSWSRL
jgi:hypothetical protein